MLFGPSAIDLCKQTNGPVNWELYVMGNVTD
jgi:hypothetical protein